MKKDKIAIATNFASIISVLISAVALYLTRQTIRHNNTSEAHRTATQLLSEYYELKDKNEFDITAPMTTEVDSYRTLFLAESIFIMMKQSDRKEAWLKTVDFMVRDAIEVAQKEAAIETFDREFQEHISPLLKAGETNRGSTTDTPEPR